MIVKLCKSCPYTPADIGRHYSVDAEEYCCIACPSLFPQPDVTVKRVRRRRNFRTGSRRPILVANVAKAAAETGPGI